MAMPFGFFIVGSGSGGGRAASTRDRSTRRQKLEGRKRLSVAERGELAGLQRSARGGQTRRTNNASRKAAEAAARTARSERARRAAATRRANRG